MSQSFSNCDPLKSNYIKKHLLTYQIYSPQIARIRSADLVTKIKALLLIKISTNLAKLT